MTKNEAALGRENVNATSERRPDTAGMVIAAVLLLIALQQLEGHIIAPQVFGHTLRINPLIVIFALLVQRHLVRGLTLGAVK